MSLNNDLEELTNGLYRPSIFYIPSNIFPDIQGKSKKELIDFGLFETVTMLKSNGDLIPAKKYFPEIELLKKQSNLENNFFQMLKLRDQLGNDAFLYLKRKYMDHLNACEYIYNYFLDNIGVEIEQVSDSEKLLFEYQKQILISHIETMKSKFSFIENFKYKSFSKMDIEVPNLFKDKRYGVLLNDSMSLNNKTQTTSKRKTYKITKQEVDNYLLRSVFNVDITNLIK